MSVQKLDFAEPFFSVKFLQDELEYDVNGRVILLNLAEEAIQIHEQGLAHLNSIIAVNTRIKNIKRAVIIERFDDHKDDETLYHAVKQKWPSAYEVRGEERLKGVSHYMSPKIWIGNIGLTMYHSGSVPLNVGLHKEHPFCPVPGFREVHTQIVGIGKMQQCYEKDLATLYFEETMAPGHTHKPMFDEEGNYPWHQFETITPSIFMAVEMLPIGATPPR